MITRYGQFSDFYRGDGWFVSTRRFTLAFRWRWHFKIYKSLEKTRIYFGPFELECRNYY